MSRILNLRCSFQLPKDCVSSAAGPASRTESPNITLERTADSFRIVQPVVVRATLRVSRATAQRERWAARMEAMNNFEPEGTNENA